VEKSILTVKPESNFGRQIMKNISHAQWTRIENRHGGGVPDLYGIYGGQAIWLELKCIKQNSISLIAFANLMELQQFSTWWEKLLYCPRYEIKGYQIIQR
jgi:hypothetical protein